MLSLIIFLPIIGSLFFFGIDNENQSISNNTLLKRNSIIKQIGLSTSLITLLFALYLFSQMNNNIGGYQFTETTVPLGFIGIDGISIYYVLLTAFITPVALLSN
jgi:NADH:ubiquinone oxidoreductase subunit 4 (subunit M)